MKVLLLAGSAFEARDLGRRLGLPVQDTVIVHSTLVAKRWKPADGDLILQAKSFTEHPEHEAIIEALLEQCGDEDVRWETESDR